MMNSADMDDSFVKERGWGDHSRAPSRIIPFRFPGIRQFYGRNKNEYDDLPSRPVMQVENPSKTELQGEGVDVGVSGSLPSDDVHGDHFQRSLFYQPVKSSNTSISRHESALLSSASPHLGSKDRAHGRSRFLQTVSGVDAGKLFAGGFTALLKIACLLLARSFWGNIWPYLEVFSVCSLSISSLKSLVPQVQSIPNGPLQGLATPVLSISVAKPLVRWALPDAYRTARFWKRLLPIYAGYMRTKYLARKKSGEDKRKLWQTRHEWGGDRVHRLVLDLSGFYVKSAQILATKADFVPEPWVRRLSNHLDNAPPRPFVEVKRSIQQQLGKCPRGKVMAKDSNGLVPLDAAFSCVEETCIAAASIAQVHGATLKDGARVVIKVQHLGMELVMNSDLRNIVWVAKFLEGQLPFDLTPIVKEIQKTIPLEFNFEREIWFMRIIKENLQKGGFDRIVCPEPVSDLCATRLLVMERLEGVPFTRILHPEASNELKSRVPEVVGSVEYLVQAFGQMLLQDGIFHADPHAGNLLLLSDGRLGLIDFGQSKVLEFDLRQKLAHLILALGGNDDDEIATALLDLGMGFKKAKGGAVQSSTLAVMARIMFDTCYVKEATVSPMAEESILKETPLTTFNQSLWLVVRAMVLLRGLCYVLNMDLSSCALWRTYALSALEEQDGNSLCEPDWK